MKALLGTNPFHVPVYRFHSASLTFPEFCRADSVAVANQGREEMQKQRRDGLETLVQQ